MPGFVTHYVYGVLAYKALEDSAIKSTIRKHHNSYSLGLQGPDLFFYFAPTILGPLPNIANLMHKKRTGSFFGALIDSVSVFDHDDDYEIAYAYIMGFMGHYLLDTAVHPYVYSRVGTDPAMRSIGVHFGLETDIDREVLRFYKGLSLTDFPHDRAVNLTSKEKKVISRLLGIAILKTYGIALSEKITCLAISSFRLGNAFLMDPNNTKYNVIDFVERHTIRCNLISQLLINDIVHSHDCMNAEHSTWFNPFVHGAFSTDSVYDIIDKNVGRYCNYMTKMHHALSNSKNMVQDDSPVILNLLGNRSYSTGVDCRHQL